MLQSLSFIINIIIIISNINIIISSSAGNNEDLVFSHI